MIAVSAPPGQPPHQWSYFVPEPTVAPILQIVIASTRPGRVGPSVARWVQERAVSRGGFTVELVDLAEVNLPMFDEPKHPRFGEYVHDHTRAWSATVERADAYIFVLPEYNHGFNAALKNALDYLSAEWQYKPAGLVSYGGVAAGTRAVQMLKPVISALKMVPLTESVNVPFVHSLLDAEGNLRPNDVMEVSVAGLLAELARWADALRELRKPAGLA
jgi:NAD(P)H-dependent FMN reductase